MLSELYTII